MRRVFERATITLALGILAAGCAVTRVEPPPTVTAPAEFKEAAFWQRARAATPVPDAWWTLFGDPVLDDLEQRLVIGNENLKAALTQVASARATLDASRTAPFPTLGASLVGSRSGSPSATATPGSVNPANSVSLGLAASWEIDLWRRLAQATEGAQASFQASLDDLAALRLSTQALLAQTYFTLRAAESQQAIYRRSALAYQRSLDLTRIRYEGGVAPRTDLLQAETQLRNAQAQLADTVAQRAQAEHAIAVLLGLPPAALALPPGAALPKPPEVPPLLPATLLERRPDIAAAERRVVAAWSQIGVVDAAFFPTLTLSANAGYRRSTFADLVSAPNLFWSIGPALAQSIFDGGQRRLASAQARASAEAAAASYRQTVLTALQEVEDNLIAANQLQQEVQFVEQAVQAAQRNLAITLDQYRGGTVSYLAVVNAQTAALGSESSLVALRNRLLAAVNQLLKNIAGRWQAG